SLTSKSVWKGYVAGALVSALSFGVGLDAGLVGRFGLDVVLLVLGYQVAYPTIALRDALELNFPGFL
ncbi:hypothetical protein, partial [Acidisphaera rubrifaciens]|uniref:hypothetical protein n=1 Tax=Acidisphaera rubrifaciens TaxID=50715 RepID=UPI0019D6FF24